jgi:hypothetical protein
VSGHRAAIPALQELDLGATEIDDGAIKALLKLTKLPKLNLFNDPRVTEDAIRLLERLPELQELPFKFRDQDGYEVMRKFMPRMRMRH